MHSVHPNSTGQQWDKPEDDSLRLGIARQPTGMQLALRRILHAIGEVEADAG
jgi:hypothetical protein